ncbi:MAG: Thermophilic serine proteinase precursor [Bryobacterales bacterium]|nr:Thermophilic serine proteinase precursor [Bryobacterales bacterium]
MSDHSTVFVSSTAEDLIPYRQAARDAVLEVGLRPEMMEYFAASAGPSLPECLARVSPCDVVVVMLAKRYGWVPPDQPGGSAKSITWLECEHAASLGRDLLVFIHDPKTSWSIEHTEAFRLTEAVNRGAFRPELPSEVARNIEKLAEFQRWLESGRTRVTFTTPEDLRARIILSLYRWLDRNRERVPAAVEEGTELRNLTVSGYRIFQGLPLNRFSNGVDGSILILIDERIEGLSGGVRNDPYSGIGTLHLELDPRNWSLRPDEIKQALLVIVDEKLRFLYSEPLGRESARLDRVFLYRDRSHPTFVVTRDYSIEWGSYNGPISYFLEVSDGGIRYILPHGLMTSLKTAWAIDNRENSAAIISKKCRPNFDPKDGPSMDFKVIYERFSFDGEGWKESVSEEDGFWENEKPLDEQEFRKRFQSDPRNCFERVYRAMQALSGSATIRHRLELVNELIGPLLIDDFPEHMRDSVTAFRQQLVKNRSDVTSDQKREEMAKAFLSIYTKAARLDGILQQIV